MLIAIPTYGRVNNQRTLLALPPRIRKSVTLFVRHDEYALYSRQWPDIYCAALPHDITTIGQTRDHILEWASPANVLMLDDDLDFAVRRTDDPTKFLPAKSRDIEDMIDALQHNAGRFGHSGIRSREGANRGVEPFLYNGRILRVHAFNTEVLRNFSIRFSRIKFMEDFDVTLQLLRLGFKNCISNNWVHNQPGSNLAGGCSSQRTMVAQSVAAHTLAELHPGYVQIVTKGPVGAWKESRTDVRIAWKKAYEYGRAFRSAALLDGREGDGADGARFRCHQALE